MFCCLRISARYNNDFAISYAKEEFMCGEFFILKFNKTLTFISGGNKNFLWELVFFKDKVFGRLQNGSNV